MANTTTHEGLEGHLAEERSTIKTVATGSLASGIVGAGSVAVSILALAHVLPELFACIAVIAIGVSLLFESGAIAARFSTLLEETGTNTRMETAELSGGMSGELLGGAAGLALGILALVGVVPYVLIPVSLLAFGGALMIGSGLTARLNAAHLMQHEHSETTKRVIDEAVSAAAGVQVLIGLGAAVLGILALIGISPLTLSLVGLLGVAFANLFGGTAVGGKMLSLVRH